MDDIVESIFKSVLRLFGYVARLLVWLILEGFEEIAWYIGWPICRLLTFGRFPKEFINQHKQATNLTNFLVSVVGFVSLVLIGVMLFNLVYV